MILVNLAEVGFITQEDCQQEGFLLLRSSKNCQEVWHIESAEMAGLKEGRTERSTAYSQNI